MLFLYNDSSMKKNSAIARYIYAGQKISGGF